MARELGPLLSNSCSAFSCSEALSWTCPIPSYQSCGSLIPVACRVLAYNCPHQQEQEGQCQHGTVAEFKGMCDFNVGRL